MRIETHQQEGQPQSIAVSSKVDDNSSVSSNDNNVNQIPDLKFKIENNNSFSPINTKAWTNFAKGSPDANFILSTIVKGHNKLLSEITIGNFVSAQAVGNII